MSQWKQDGEEQWKTVIKFANKVLPTKQFVCNEIWNINVTISPFIEIFGI